MSEENVLPKEIPEKRIIKSGWGCTVRIIVIIMLLYLVYNTREMFGFWTIIWTMCLSGFSTLALPNLISGRTEKKGVVTFNPKEWPKFLNLAVCASIGYYLYTILEAEERAVNDYAFGMCFLLMLFALPIIYSLYTLIRDRNDYIEISESTVKYKDNDETGEFPLNEIKDVKPHVDGIQLTLANEQKKVIKISQMNFSLRDIIELLVETKTRFPGNDSSQGIDYGKGGDGPDQ